MLLLFTQRAVLAGREAGEIAKEKDIQGRQKANIPGAEESRNVGFCLTLESLPH